MYSPPRRMSTGTTCPDRPGCLAPRSTISGLSAISAGIASISSARRAFADQKSNQARASSVSRNGPTWAATTAESSSRMRSTSAPSASCASRHALPSSTATSGSTNSVWPLPEASWTMPLTWPRASDRIGITYRPPRRVTMGSCSDPASSPEWMNWSRRLRRRS